ncbi:N-acetyldiaminopimelate deacetylase [Dialister hominis]|uniref:N-acetyldiaminopimelate deacetylase n=1 Tax=Dialister hominis TaxID=2582419 RepID=UPI003FF147EF
MLKEDDLITIRRHLHQIPEVALEEVETHAFLMQVIGMMDQKFLKILEPKELPTAILVRVQGSDPSRTIGYRTDIDGLPVDEKTGLPYASQHPGKMHACGHDMHMTVALGVLDYFASHQPKDNLVFFFQPAEESEAGGRRAYELGLFEGEWRPDEFYGLHVNPKMQTGVIGCRMGTLFAGTTEVNIDVIGKGGHAAFPQDAKDAVVAASALVMQVQTIISRSINPIESGVITLGKFEAGTIRNVIADHARLEGTIRGLTQVMIEKIKERVQEICEGIERSFEVEVRLGLNQGGYFPVENDPVLTKRFIRFMQENPDVVYEEVPPAMTGEDFGYLLHQFSGTMFWLGVDGGAQLHESSMSPKEGAIQKGITAITEFLEYRMITEE